MKILRYLDKHIEEYFLVITSAVLVISIFVQITLRNLIDFSLSWTEELARYSFIWMIFLGVSYAVKKNRHLKIDALELIFKRNGNFVLNTISNIIFFVFSIIVVYYGVLTDFVITRLTPSLGISYGWVYASSLVGFTLTGLRLIQNQWNLIVRWRNKEDDEK